MLRVVTVMIWYRQKVQYAQLASGWLRMYSTALSTVPAQRCQCLGVLKSSAGENLPLWMVSASLSGISMLNSCIGTGYQRRNIMLPP